MSNTLGDRIKILRGSLTQRQFAEKIDIPATTLGNYEKNKSELNFATIDLFTKASRLEEIVLAISFIYFSD